MWTAAPVDPSAAQRIARDEAAFKAAGFDCPPPLYAAGTPLVQLGVENWTRQRGEWEALPRAHGALSALSVALHAEDRTALTVPANKVELSSTGQLLLPGGGTPALTPHAFDTLTRRVLAAPRGFAGYVRDCPPTLRADNVNHWLARQDSDRALVVRDRAMAGNGHRQGFAVVSPNYTVLDATTLAGMLGDPESFMLNADFLDLVRPDDRAEVLYDDCRARFSVVRFSDVPAPQAAAGEFFKASVFVETADDGTRGIHVGAAVWRNLCLNLIVVRQSRVMVDSLPHLGDRASLIGRFARALRGALEKIECFGPQYERAIGDDVRAAVPGFTLKTPVGDVVRWLFAEQQKLLGTTLNPNVVAKAVQAAWEKEPAYTRAGLVNAVSRAAHEGTWSSPWVGQELEMAAGRLLAAEAIPYGAMSEAEYEERQRKVRARKAAEVEAEPDEA